MRILADLLEGMPIVTREADPRVLGPVAEVWPEERAAVERAVAKRKNEYFATRHLAREALDELAIPKSAILNNDDRSPRWPSGVVGSLSHTDSWCAVALTRPSCGIRSLGIDLERLGSVSPEIAQRILSERELSVSNGEGASLRFSAKEAFYKAVYPFVRRYVGFSEVEIEIAANTRTFEILVVAEQLRAELQAMRIWGFYATQSGLCCAAVIVR